MLSKKIEEALNMQVELEASSSQYYLAMASWAETQGFIGASQFMYKHADEERIHMLKLVKFVNERGGKAKIPALKAPPQSYKSFSSLFQEILKHETLVSSEINKLVDICLKDKDYATHNFLQWYVTEQMEEEALARTILDKLKLVGGDKGALYLFDRELQTMAAAPSADQV